ncbi:isopentenyl phosphate kinase family protein [Patescibacteria group bacterium]|nr:isopentenyl phosphate kinase family protein [Patescibacteria group bacterium]
MKQQLLLIKLGGSIITDKNKSLPTLKTSIIKRISQQLKNIYQSGKYQIILIHGAGSYGHPLAKKYNLHLGMKTREQKCGFCLTDHSMLRLNSIIMDYLLQASIPAVSLPPRSFITQSGGKLQDFNYHLIKSYLAQNQIPVLFGDVVLDNKWGCSIISGDTIVSYLAKNLKADLVIFLSDVDGIFDSDPKKNPKAKLIPEVTDKNLKQVLQGLTTNNQNDVTGEMQGKIMAIKNNLAHIPVYIINGLKAENLAKTVEQVQVGTKLLFR